MVRSVKKSKFPVKQVQAEELIDPVLYTGGLDKERYPFLKPKEIKDERQEVENPLDKRPTN